MHVPQMGSPLDPDATQYTALETASAMRPQPVALRAQDRGAIAAASDLPRQGVALVVLEKD